MSKFSVKKIHGDGWELWEHSEGFKRQVCVMTANDILQIFNETVPRTIDEPFVKGDPNCTHAWRPWKFNDNFLVCFKCPAMRKVKRLVPKTYE